MTQTEHSPSSSAGWIIRLVAIAAAIVVAFWLGTRLRTQAYGSGDSGAEARVVAPTPEKAGRYLIMAGGCNDCHTSGFMEKGMQIPESEWLTGVPLGWRGPWGTTYASNLRLSAQDFQEDLWVRIMSSRDQRPPMPWTALHAMHEQDLRAIYRYLKHLGPRGERTPAALPPGQEPATPYLSMQPILPHPATVPAAP